MKDISKIFQDFFSSNTYGDLSHVAIFVSREDGQLIYKRDSQESQLNDLSFGALLSGVWQASVELGKRAFKDNDINSFRLSFDNSSSGIYILALNYLEDAYYLGITYENSDNPGAMKYLVRKIKMDFESYTGTVETVESSNETKQLFDNLSNDEMDKLFSFAGS